MTSFIDCSKIPFIGRSLAKKSDLSAVLAPVEGGLDPEARTRSTEGRFQDFLGGRFFEASQCANVFCLCRLSTCTLVRVLLEPFLLG